MWFSVSYKTNIDDFKTCTRHSARKLNIRLMYHVLNEELMISRIHASSAEVIQEKCERDIETLTTKSQTRDGTH